MLFPILQLLVFQIKRLNTNIENRVSVETVVGEVTLDHHNR